ncbi:MULTISPECIES: ABC transporter ATP-binding protein [unclassified Paenibacillus]|uniref:ABC transporter ATP-binding protein n=1 Tax=unclassified Paenibacillus TaxID=185978 RepID=UPI0003E21483|nr:MULTISPECIES: ABC transporter ATP-binding protein [unclassified Paenibacillus]ETT45535.1 ABC-type multidrug transport system, ATPase component [Paenibacillus sp. FSL R7-269]OMF91658.1 multidrug ABC transporter ATP-binding protein [Paenibacillus sp. FSL R7-0337]
MVINVQGVTKIYKGSGGSEIFANDDLNLSVKEGEILGLLGHNGAGKTTLVSQIIGLTKPTRGEIYVLGESVINDPARARKLCSIQPQSQVPLGELTPLKAVTIMGEMRGGKQSEVIKQAERLFEALDISQWSKTEGTKLSGGVRRLTAFCMSVVQAGKIIILDEPTNDVDPVRRRYLWNEIRNLTKEGVSVILVTHNVLEAEKAVDRVAILHKGKIITQGTPSEVKGSISSHLRIEASLSAGIDKVDLPGWALSSNQDNGRIAIYINPNTVVEVIEWAKSQIDEGKFLDYSLSPTSLEDVYVKLTGGKEGSAL